MCCLCWRSVWSGALASAVRCVRQARWPVRLKSIDPMRWTACWLAGGRVVNHALDPRRSPRRRAGPAADNRTAEPAQSTAGSCRGERTTIVHQKVTSAPFIAHIRLCCTRGRVPDKRLGCVSARVRCRCCVALPFQTATIMSDHGVGGTPLSVRPPSQSAATAPTPHSSSFPVSSVAIPPVANPVPPSVSGAASDADRQKCNTMKSKALGSSPFPHVSPSAVCVRPRIVSTHSLRGCHPSCVQADECSSCYDR